MTRMTNKRLISTVLIMLLLFAAVIGGAGCDGGSSSSPSGNEQNNNNNNFTPRPTPIQTPDPTPTPTPKSVFTVTFNSNGGSSVASQNVVAGEQAVAPADPMRSGYIFDIWCSDEELTEAFSFNTLITDNTTLYARWNKLFTVSFNTDGGSEIPSQTVLEYANAEVPEESPVKEGYTFWGGTTKEETHSYSTTK